MLYVGNSTISDVTLIWQLSFSGPPLEMSDDKMEHSKNGIFLFELEYTQTYKKYQILSVAARFVEKVHHFR